jgi:hypothetical protein
MNLAYPFGSADISMGASLAIPMYNVPNTKGRKKAESNLVNCFKGVLINFLKLLLIRGAN